MPTWTVQKDTDSKDEYGNNYDIKGPQLSSFSMTKDQKPFPWPTAGYSNFSSDTYISNSPTEGLTSTHRAEKKQRTSYLQREICSYCHLRTRALLAVDCLAHQHGTLAPTPTKEEEDKEWRGGGGEREEWGEGEDAEGKEGRERESNLSLSPRPASLSHTHSC